MIRIGMKVYVLFLLICSEDLRLRDCFALSEVGCYKMDDGCAYIHKQRVSSGGFLMCDTLW